VSKTTVHHRACNLCEAICGIEIEVEDDRITAIRGDADDPLSRGHICPKAVALQDIQNDPDRLRHPQLRTADGWRRIGWEEAFDLAARRLLEVRERHGRDAVAVYLGNPNVHSSGALLFGPPLLRALTSSAPTTSWSWAPTRWCRTAA
jgi:anaerobic selenocysteine-containing dehydrogenase